jgi:dolichol kinase
VTLLALCEWVTSRFRLTAEAGRKLGHVVGALAAAALPLLMHLEEIAVLAGLFVPFMLISRQRNWFPLIHSAERTSFGETSFALGICLTAILASDNTDYVTAVLVMGVSDPLAALVGGRFGTRRLPNGKSLEGSLTFFCSSLAITRSPTIALALTACELALAFGLDNVAVPVLATVMLTA